MQTPNKIGEDQSIKLPKLEEKLSLPDSITSEISKEPKIFFPDENDKFEVDSSPKKVET